MESKFQFIAEKPNIMIEAKYAKTSPKITLYTTRLYLVNAIFPHSVRKVNSRCFGDAKFLVFYTTSAAYALLPDTVPLAR